MVVPQEEDVLKLANIHEARLLASPSQKQQTVREKMTSTGAETLDGGGEAPSTEGGLTFFAATTRLGHSAAVCPKPRHL